MSILSQLFVATFKAASSPPPPPPPPSGVNFILNQSYVAAPPPVNFVLDESYIPPN